MVKIKNGLKTLMINNSTFQRELDMIELLIKQSSIVTRNLFILDCYNSEFISSSNTFRIDKEISNRLGHIG